MMDNEQMRQGLWDRGETEAVESMDEMRKVRLSVGLMHNLVAAASARGFVIEWGEPDAEGFYTPTITAQDAD